MNAALVKLDVAAATLGWSAVKLLSLADEGTLLEPGFEWVWNLANNVEGERRDLRFWWFEIELRKDAKSSNYTLERVIEAILPQTRKSFQAGEIDALFQIRHRTRIDLRDQLKSTMKSGANTYHRDDLADFLRARWLGKNKMKLQPA